uniref:Uncharacterized protein n=1 Tax=Sphaerodactylus townsendi TaxID=933632 RepID=A0ACB8F9V4_9SAUR
MPHLLKMEEDTTLKKLILECSKPRLCAVGAHCGCTEDPSKNISYSEKNRPFCKTYLPLLHQSSVVALKKMELFGTGTKLVNFQRQLNAVQLSATILECIIKMCWKNSHVFVISSYSAMLKE